jgi:hypothetical protein
MCLTPAQTNKRTSLNRAPTAGSDSTQGKKCRANGVASAKRRECCDAIRKRMSASTFRLPKADIPLPAKPCLSASAGVRPTLSIGRTGALPESRRRVGECPRSSWANSAPWIYSKECDQSWRRRPRKARWIIDAGQTGAASRARALRTSRMLSPPSIASRIGSSGRGDYGPSQCRATAGRGLSPRAAPECALLTPGDLNDPEETLLRARRVRFSPLLSATWLTISTSLRRSS